MNASDNTDNAIFSLTVNAQPSKLNRFTEVDVSSANNDNGGYYNASNHPNSNAFALGIAITRGRICASSR
jgi:hypothetical protein